MDVIYLYLLTVPVFFAIDMVWLGFAARTFYRTHLGPLLRPSVNWPAAILFYLLYIAGILIFATLPALEDRSLQQATVMGGLFGFFAYATYDLTNLATLKDWPVKVVVVDILWGIVLTASVSTASYGIGRWLMP
ncbi:MAG: DUF2177 family protein [Syntrophales bacterium]|nr:DUF2177 family protein [Syntrophales bacterium]